MRLAYPLIALLLVSCATYRREYQAAIDKAKADPWVGKHRTEVIAAWGVPSHKEPLDDGGELWVYEYSSEAKRTNIRSNPISGKLWGTSTEETTRVARRAFWIDTSGIVTRWAWKGFER